MSRIVTITLNPAIDVYTTVERIAPAVKMRCDSERRDPGGGGVNVARVVRRLGGDALAIYAAGGSIGAQLRQLILGEGVRAIETLINGETRESFTIAERASGQEFRFLLPGPMFGERDLEHVIEAVEGLAPPYPLYVVCSGSLPRGAPEDSYARIAKAVTAHGSRMVLDASGPALRAALNSGAIHLVKPSLSEFQELAGRRLETTSEIVTAARACVAEGQAEIVVVTLGSRGAVLVTAQQALAAEAITTPIISSVGAGDSFLGAMIWALEGGHNLVDAFRYGVAAGAASLAAPGTELCAASKVQALLPLACPIAIDV